MLGRMFVRGLATAATKPYPFSSMVSTPALPPPPENKDRMLVGKGLMAHLHKTLPLPATQNLIDLFSKKNKKPILPGSVLSVTLAHAPNNFSGVLIAVRRKGPDTSFTLRNVVQRTGVEMRFSAGSPVIKDVKVIQYAGGGGGKGGRRMRRAKLYYLRDQPQKMNAISAGVKRATANQ
ncbi:60S ribosomal protein subunit img1 [Ceratobasidium theobromae]|uniref:60S ribosomal protein subunit img1 n=1 Tax=Ceratobasidium theobromae TaxID=1582974 RepID=A0A5N5QQG1_9AGAM|nr:60S ribosomal protein subunit img1 [Ceratobasidium theobromae]